MASTELIQAIAVTAELCGRSFSPEAAAVFVADLDGYPEAQVAAALKRCRREVRGLLTLQDVVSRIDDGRPGPDEAWAMVPKDERGSVVWTDEMREAYRVASPLLAEGDAIAARMAFRETYGKLCTVARDRRLPPNWTPSLGHDVAGREIAVREAVEHGRIGFTYAQAVVPSLPAPSVDVLALTSPIVERLPA